MTDRPHGVHKGDFLIANPEIENPLFFRGVMLICEHNISGSFALLINKPLHLELPEEIINLTSSANKNISIRAGGPVQTNQMMLLHSINAPKQQLLNVTEGVYLGGDIQFLHELLEDENEPNVFLCFGYAGWANGQLEKEVLEGSWFTSPATKELIFNADPKQLWRQLLLQMGGKYATLSTIPEDPSMN
jgi:putative transcriptional regulator